MTQDYVRHSYKKDAESDPCITHEYNVAMTCDGCSNAVRRVLGKLDGIENVECDVANRKVKVTTSLDKETVLAQIKKTGKETSLA